MVANCASTAVSARPARRLLRGLRRIGTALGGRQVMPVPELAGAEYRVRVLGLAAAAVIAAERHEKVATLAVHIVPQDHATEAQVGLHVEQFAGVAVADDARPERHHLHVAARADRADRELAEIA